MPEWVSLSDGQFLGLLVTALAVTGAAWLRLQKMNAARLQLAMEESAHRSRDLLEYHLGRDREQRRRLEMYQRRVRRPSPARPTGLGIHLWKRHPWTRPTNNA